MKKILALGDSFTYGEELRDRNNCWASLVGRRLGYTVENFGIPGGSNPRAVRILFEQNIKDYALVLIGWSHYDRMELADEVGVYDSWPGGQRTIFRQQAPWRSQIIDYITVHHNDDYLYRQYLMMIIQIQSYLKVNQIDYVMMDTFGNHKDPRRHAPGNAKLTAQVDSNHFIGWPDETMAEWTAGLPCGSGGHFLDQGHAVVAEKIYQRLLALGHKHV
jgi:hypothetical protein